MDLTLIRLITRATRAGTELAITNGQLRVRGAPPETLDQLRTRRDDLIALLTGPCAACGDPPWIHEHATGIPWCRPCARLRGTQLLRHEHPNLTTTQEVA